MMEKSRKDAVRNRSELLAAAEAAVAAKGVHAPLNVIALRAGVGRATLYRHFPTREALLEGLIDRSLDILEGYAAAATGTDALTAILGKYAAHAREHSALANYWRAVGPEHPVIVVARRRFADIVGPALKRGIAAGTCRPDLTVTDVRSLLAMLGAIPSGAGHRDEFLPDRVLTLVVEGLRPR